MASTDNPSANGLSSILWAPFALAATIIRPLSTLKLLPLNFAPVGGLAVYSGAKCRLWLACLIPVAVMLVTDCILWAVKGIEYSPLHVSRPATYGSFALYAVIGWLLIRGNNPLRIGAASVLGSTQFFVVTNFGAWLELPQLYSRDLAGLWQCFAAGLPFHNPGDPLGYFGFTLLSDLAFTALFFAVHAIVVHNLERAPVEAAPVEAP